LAVELEKMGWRWFAGKCKRTTIRARRSRRGVAGGDRREGGKEREVEWEWRSSKTSGASSVVAILGRPAEPGPPFVDPELAAITQEGKHRQLTARQQMPQG
jgi:hypothetical protein